MLVLSDLFTERQQYEWMLDTLFDVYRTHPQEDELVTQYIVVGVCKAAAITGMVSVTVIDNSVRPVFRGHLYTVKPVFKGHCNEGTPCYQGTLSQNGVLSVMKGHFLFDIKVSLIDRFYCIP